MSEDTRRALARWVDGVNAHDLDAIGHAITDDLHWQLWDASTRGRALSIEAWRLLFEGVPDWRMEPLTILAEPGRAAALWKMTGSHTGPLRFRGTASMEHPIPPTGRSFAVEGMSYHEFREGQMSVNRAYWRPDQMLTQLGVKLA